MTIDDVSSIYVGGLSFDVSEDTLRHVFDIYGAVLAVKIHNERATRGTCYGFITFANPRSAAHAIREMNGQRICGRVVRVDEVRSKGRLNFNRGYPRHDIDRGFEDDGRRGPRRDFGYDRQNHRYVYRERFQDYEKENETGHYQHYVYLDQFEGDYEHRGNVVNGPGRFRKRERYWERESSFNGVEPRNTSRQKSVDRNNNHQMKDHRYVAGDRSDSGPKGDAEKGRVTKRACDLERESSFNSGEPRNNGRQKSVDRNNHHQMKDHRYDDGDQFDNGPNGDVEHRHVMKRERDRKRESRSTSVETRNNSRQKSVDRNSHHQMTDNRYVVGDQFDNEPKGDVEPVCVRRGERVCESDSSFNSEDAGVNSHQKSVDRDNHPPNRSSFSYDRSRGPSVESLNGDQDQIETKLVASDQKVVKLREEISHMEDDAADKEEEVSQLRDKYQKLDESSNAATKLTSDRHMQLEKLYKCYLQVKDYEKKLKEAEEELQLIVDATRAELEREGVQVI